MILVRSLNTVEFDFMIEWPSTVLSYQAKLQPTF